MTNTFHSVGSLSFGGNTRSQLQRPHWMTERRNIFKRNKGKKRKIVWDHEFVCLSYCGEETPPSPLCKAELIRAGLGPRKVSISEDVDGEEFRDAIFNSFPGLKDGGGFQLLRTKHGTNRELCVIPLPKSGYTVHYIRSVAGQAKIYIRPIQKDLSLEPLLDNIEAEPNEKCLSCGKSIPLHLLPLHVDKCK